MKNLFKWLRKYIHILLTTLVINAIVLWLFSYLPFLISYVFARINQSARQSHLPNILLKFFSQYEDILEIVIIVAITMLLLQIIRAALNFTSSYLEAKLKQDIAKDMRETMFSSVQDLSLTFHKKTDTGDLIQRCTSDIETASTFLSSQLPIIVDILLMIIIASVRMYSINTSLMLVSMIIIPITISSSIIFARKMDKEFEKNAESESDLITCISENINSNKVVRAFSNEIYELEKMEDYNLKLRQSDIRLGFGLSVYWGINDFLASLQLSATVLITVYLGINGHLSLEDLTASIFLITMIIWPMRGLGRVVNNFGRAKVAANRLQEILDVESEFSTNGNLQPVITGNIEFKNVYFRFDDEDKHFLNDVSFNIKKGQTIAIIGKTGSGKSTICNLLTRMLEYDSGSILIDGTDIKDIDKRHLRKNIKIVLQDPFLFSKTIEENLAMAKDNTSFVEIENATKQAHIYKDINKFPKKFKTLVGEKGTTLSGGQKQRMAIARVLLHNSSVVIFDDSLSALDTKTDLMIRQSLKGRKNNQTTIIVTHKTTSAKEADVIIVLNDGKVQAIGSHDYLSTTDGFYKDLWDIQGKLQDEFFEMLKEGE